MCSTKHNQNDFKNYKIELPELLYHEADHLIALRTLGWESIKIERKKAKAKSKCKILNEMVPKSLTECFST